MMVTANITEPRYKFAQSKANEIWEKFVDKNIPVKLNDIVKSMDGVTRMDKMRNEDKTLDDIIKRYRVSRDAAGIAVKSNRLLNKLKV